MDEKQMVEKFSQVITLATQQRKIYLLRLNPLEVAILHGAITLTLKHPEVRQTLIGANAILTNLRERICQLMLEMGFSQEEVEWLNKKEV